MTATSFLVASGIGQVRAQTAFCGAIPVGTYATGFNCAPAIGTPAGLSTSPGTRIDAPVGAGLRAAARNADATITVTGSEVFGNAPAAANGIHAQVTSGAGNASVVFSGTANSIVLGANGDNGVFLQNNTSGSSSIAVTTGSALNIFNNGSTGSERDGIDINSTGSGNASILHNGTGTIATANGNGFWVKAASGGSARVEVGAGVSFLVGKPNAAGNYAGIHTRVLGGGDTAILSGASVQASGVNAYGLYTQSDSGATSIFNTGGIATNGLNGFGIRSAATAAGAVSVVNAGDIFTTGTAAHGIYLTSQGGDISVENNGAITVGIPSATDGSRGIYINANVAGNIDVAGRGDITVLGDASSTRGHAIILNTTAGNIGVDYAGNLRSHGNGAGGIRADATAGNVRVDYSGRRIETFNQDGTGIYASSRSATGTVDVRASGTIITHGDAGSGYGSGSGAFGLEGISYGGDVGVAFSGRLIDVNGAGAAILAANAYFTGTGLGAVSVDNSGSVVARGDKQQGVRTFSTAGQQTILNRGDIRTLGSTDSQGIWAITNGAAPILVGNSGFIATVGTNASGIDAVSQGSTVSIVNAGGISAGWGTSAGVVLGGSTQTLTNTGIIQALSDVAVRADSAGFDGSLGILNSGVMIGALSASSSTVLVDNRGSWSLRNFADSDGDQIRDRLAVAVSDLGVSAANAIVNSGTIALAGPGNASVQSLDTTGQYLPLGYTINAMTLGGPVQAQLLGVRTFQNSGIIDLTMNPNNGTPIVGAVLVISGGHVAGRDGGGVYVADGGQIRFNTTLNEGGANSRSDIVVLDATRLGAAQTRLAVANVGGLGALTAGNGIALIEVLNKPGSDGGVFALAGRAAAGPYEYTLSHGGIGPDSGDGNWYLRSTLNCDLLPAAEECKQPGPVPHLRVETSLYAAIPSMAILYGRAMLDTFHERVGEEKDQRVRADPENGKVGWARMVGVSGHRQGDAIGVFGTGPSFDYAFMGLQAGMDVYRHDRPDGSRDQAGVYFAAGGNQGRVTHFDGSRGDTNFQGYTLGSYWTHFGANGWYTDAILQGTFYDISSAAGRDLPTLKTGGQGAAGSFEGGYPFKFRGGYFIEPQAQIVYQNIHINDANDVAAQIRFSNVESLATRIGARFGRTWTAGDMARTITAWIRPSLWSEFFGTPLTSFSSESGFVPIRADMKGLWGELNFGISGQLTDATTLYANASYSNRFEGGGVAYSGKAGVRVSW